MNYIVHFCATAFTTFFRGFTYILIQTDINLMKGYETYIV